VSEKELEEQAEVIVDSATRCGAITRQLLSFARPSGLRARSVDVGEVIHDVMRFQVKEAAYRNISVSVDVAPEVPEIETDRGKLQEILLNLVMNAFDAMPDGGDLKISARANGRDEVSIDVADTGCGMSEETMLSAFEPFFTTKPEGLGTGLGLSITYGLVGRLEGRITVESELGQGTRFTVVLPVRPENGGVS
jgi:signal transduction histidine kinase